MCNEMLVMQLFIKETETFRQIIILFNIQRIQIIIQTFREFINKIAVLLQQTKGTTVRIQKTD